MLRTLSGTHRIEPCRSRDNLIARHATRMYAITSFLALRERRFWRL